MKLKPTKPKDIKNFINSFKRPQTWFKIFNQIYPLGSGGLRTEAIREAPSIDTSDFTMPYDYSSNSQAPWQTFRDLGLGQLPQGGQPARPAQRHGETPKQDPRFAKGWPEIPPVPQIPRIDDLIEDDPPYTDPTHPVETSDEATDEGDTDTDDKRPPRRRPPEYDVWSCEGQEYYLGIPCPRGAKEISISTSKKLPQLSKSKKSSQSRKRYYSHQKSQHRQGFYSRYNLF